MGLIEYLGVEIKMYIYNILVQLIYYSQGKHKYVQQC